MLKPILFSLALFMSTSFAAESLKVGDDAPAFELKGSDGKTTLLDYIAAVFIDIGSSKPTHSRRKRQLAGTGVALGQ